MQKVAKQNLNFLLRKEGHRREGVFFYGFLCLKMKLIMIFFFYIYDPNYKLTCSFFFRIKCLRIWILMVSTKTYKNEWTVEKIYYLIIVFKNKSNVFLLQYFFTNFIFYLNDICFFPGPTRTSDYDCSICLGETRHGIYRLMRNIINFNFLFIYEAGGYVW